MKSDRNLLNELARTSDMLYELSEDERMRLKSLMISMYKDLAEVCKNNSLSLMLIGGSALGAVRHKGFIPWDDDLDVCMPRSDYNKLLSLLNNGMFGEQYDFTAPSSERDSKNNHLKIYRKNTTNAEIFEGSMPFPKGVFIDVFPVENAPAPSALTSIRGFWVDCLSMISVCALYAQYPSDEFERFMKTNRSAYKRYRLRMTVGKIALCFGKHAKWAYWSDKAAQYKKETDYCTIPTGTKRYCGELLPRRVFFPESKGSFEGMQVLLPGDVDCYLKNMYKDYMSLPPVDKRERHFVYKFSLGEEF